MKRFFALLSLSALLFQALPTAAVPPVRTKIKSFAEWCQQKNNVPDKTRRTIDILLKEAGTEDCQIANTKVKNITSLNLNDREIDLRVLSAVSNLKELYLRSNKISDIKPLATLTKLTDLVLHDNQIRDLKPLTNLVNSTYLGLLDNQISDVKPLAGLTKLTGLYLGKNKINDIKPLVNLIELNALILNENKISDVKSLAGLTKLTSLFLNNNQISDVKPLASLTNLTYLNINNNQISDLEPLAGLNNFKRFDISPQTYPVQANTPPVPKKVNTPPAPKKANIPPAPKRLVRTLEVPSIVSVAALSRDRQTLVTAEGSSITVWNLATGASHSHTLLDSKYATISQLAISPDGSTLITGSSGMDIQTSSNGGGCSGLSCDWGRKSSSFKSMMGWAIQLWEMNTGKGIGKLASAPEDIFASYELRVLRYGLEFSSDGKILFTQDEKGKIFAWEYPNGTIKPESDTVDRSNKPNSEIEISNNDKTSKIEIFAID